MERSRKPLPQTLRALMEEQDVSLREVVRRTKRQSGWGSPHGVSLLLHGELRPTPEAMEHLARAFQVKPEVFAEYRLAMERRRFDPDQVGFKAALRNLEKS